MTLPSPIDGLDEAFIKLIDFIPLPMLVSKEIGMNAAGHLLTSNQYLNRAFLQVIGYTLEEIPTRAEWHRLAYPDPDERQSYAAAWQQKADALLAQGETVLRTQACVRCKDGVDRWFEIISEMRSSIKDRYHIVAFVEITDLRSNVARLETLSQTDSLTGVLNRRGAQAVLERLSARAQQSGQGFSVALCDIDHFKRINDTYGHDCGDYALTAVAQVLRQCVREDDMVARWGGEEFCLIFAGGVEECAAAVARIQSQLAGTRIRWRDAAFTLAITFGLAHHDPCQSLAETLRQADSAMYYGKRAGRNRMVVYGQSPGHG